MKKKTIAILFAGHLFIDLHINLLPMLYPYFEQKFNLSYKQIGLLSTMLLCASVIQIGIGYLSDRIRTEWLLPLGIILVGTSVSLTSIFPTYWLLLISMVFIGIGSAIYHPRGLMATYLASSGRKGFGVSIWGLGGNLGYSLGPLLGALVLTTVGARGMPYLIIPVLLIVAFFLLLRREYYYLPKPKKSSSSMLTKARGAPWNQLISIGIATATMSMASHVVTSFLPLYIDKLGYRPGVSGILLTAYLGLGSLGAILGGWLSDRIGRKPIMFVCLAMYVPLILGFLFFSGISSFILFAVAGFFILAPVTLSQVLTQDLSPSNIGLMSGFSLGVSFVMGGLSGFVFGAIADAFNLKISLLSASLLVIISIAATMFIKEKRGTAFRPNQTARV
ncbi:MAG: MFS transporter [Actinobacteria bacterium]|nr:MFS transporter [Actinomycetota bacterium]